MTIDREAHDARASVGHLLRESAALGRLVERAAPLRFERPTYAEPADREGDTSRRSVGMVSDPTVLVAIDPRRLRLSAALDEADVALREARRAAARARRRLESALVQAHGEEVLLRAA